MNHFEQQKCVAAHRYTGDISRLKTTDLLVSCATSDPKALRTRDDISPMKRYISSKKDGNLQTLHIICLLWFTYMSGREHFQHSNLLPHLGKLQMNVNTCSQVSITGYSFLGLTYTHLLGKGRMASWAN